jgi:DNA topoisomerase I
VTGRLNFTEPDQPGIRRRLLGGKWRYFRDDGSPVADPCECDRLNALALPPAYRDAWFSADPAAHVQAYGIDSRGRRQYRYHAEFRQAQEERKFELCGAFGHALPKLRQRVEHDVAVRRLSRERAIASVIRLLDTGGIRVGNECYARTNKTFGATTLRMRHLRLKRDEMVLRFRGKGGVMREVRCSDAQLLRFVRKMQDLPGQHLFQYLDATGAPVPVGSADVNAYLRETMGQEFTARNFRTWTASSLALEFLLDHPGTALKPMLEQVALRLGNTPAIARKSYVHPQVIALCGEGQEGLAPLLPLPRRTRWLGRAERGLLKLLDSDIRSGGA